MLDLMDKDIQQGTCCKHCGCIMEDLIDEVNKTWTAGPGYPRVCNTCMKLLKGE